MKDYLSQAQKLAKLNKIVKKFEEAYSKDPIHGDIEDLQWEIGIYGEDHPDIVKKLNDYHDALCRNHPEYCEAMADIEDLSLDT